MPTISKNDAAEKLADVVAKAGPDDLAEFYAELNPEQPVPSSLTAGDFARHVRDELEPEEVVSLWNIMFPGSRNVWYNEETGDVHFNEELVEYLD